MTKPFRFGVVAPLRTDPPTWRDRMRRIADYGYSTLLVPDFPQTQPAPAPMLATAAALTDMRGRHLGIRVSAAPRLADRMGGAFTDPTDRRPLRDGHRHRRAGNRGRTPRQRRARQPTDRATERNSKKQSKHCVISTDTTITPPWRWPYTARKRRPWRPK